MNQYRTIIYYKIHKIHNKFTIMTSGLIDFYLTINSLIKLNYTIIKIVEI